MEIQDALLWLIGLVYAASACGYALNFHRHSDVREHLGTWGLLVGWGLWTLKNWARTALIGMLLLAGLYFATLVIFDAFAQIFGGEQIVPFLEILRISGLGLLRVLATGAALLVSAEACFACPIAACSVRLRFSLPAPEEPGPKNPAQRF